MLATVAMKLTSFCEVMPDVVVVQKQDSALGRRCRFRFLREIDASGQTSQRFLQDRVVSLRRPCCAKAAGVAVWFLKHQICSLFFIGKVWMRY